MVPRTFVFENILENIDALAGFFLKNIELFFSPLTVVDFDSQDIRKYSRRYNRGVYNLLARASQNSYFALK